MHPLDVGDVFALSSWKPFDTKIAELGGGKYRNVSWNGQEGYTLYSGIVAKSEFVAKRPAETQKLVRALTRASRWLSDAGPRSAAESLARYLKTDAKDLAYVIANNSWD